MKKNDLINLTIDDTVLEGNGVGHSDGLAVFVPETVKDDVIRAHILKVKSNYCYAKIDSIIRPSAARLPVDCGSYSKCGGCVFRHINYAEELEIKRKTVENNIKRIAGIDINIDTIISGSSYDSYRNKGQFPVSRNSEGKVTVGFFSRRSHRVVPFEKCYLHSDTMNSILSVFKEYANRFDDGTIAYDEISKAGLFRHIYVRHAAVTDKYAIVFVINGSSIPEQEYVINKYKKLLGDKLSGITLNINTRDTNVILGKKYITIYGSDFLEDEICGVKIKISPASFYQVNHEVAEKVYRKAFEFSEPAGKTIVDLYCGTGTIGLSMAKYAEKIIGVEAVADAVQNAKENARINNFNNCSFICDDASGAAKKIHSGGIHPDVIILDPPRKGCDTSLLKTITYDFYPEKIVYISCDSATLARDIKYLTENGYDLIKAVAADMFPRTGHVETVALLIRK